MILMTPRLLILTNYWFYLFKIKYLNKKATQMKLNLITFTNITVVNATMVIIVVLNISLM